MTLAVGATEFCRNFATYQRRVQREPIQVLSHDKVTGYYLSAEDFARVKQILGASRQRYHPSELPAYLMDAVKTARMDPEHDHLNELMVGE